MPTTKRAQWAVGRLVELWAAAASCSSARIAWPVDESSVILLHLPSAFSRCVNRDGEGGCGEMTVSSMASVARSASTALVVSSCGARSLRIACGRNQER